MPLTVSLLCLTSLNSDSGLTASPSGELGSENSRSLLWVSWCPGYWVKWKGLGYTHNIWGTLWEVKGVLPTTPDQESIFRLQRGASGSRQSQDSQGPPPGEKPARCFVVSLGVGVAI